MAHVAWRVARIAAHYPAHFYAGVLDHLGLGVGGGMYPVLVYVVEARRHQVVVEGPSVNGPWLSTPGDGSVHCGLRLLQGAINVETLERVHAAAQQRPFGSVTDLCARVQLSPNELERLIAAGTLDALALSRRHARWEVQFAHVRPLDQTSLLDEASWPAPPIIEVESGWERAVEEYATLGFPLSVDHPLDLYDVETAATTVVCAEQLARCVGRQVTVAGVVVAGRRIRTSGRRLMTFASLCDWSGVMELTCFEDAAERYGELLHLGRVLRVTGRVSQDVERGVGVEVHAVAELPLRGEVAMSAGGFDPWWSSEAG